MYLRYLDQQQGQASPRAGLVARTLQTLLVLQVLAVVGMSWLFHHFVPWSAASLGGAGGFGWLAWFASVGLALLALMVLRLLITAHNFSVAARWASVSPRPLDWWQRCRWFFGEFYATLYSSSWGMHHCAFAKRASSASSTLPVLLIHGYVCNSGYWQRLSRVLSQADVNHYAIDLEPVFGSIDDYVPLIHRAVEAICAETGQQRVIIVAHSMGGLAARAYLRAQGSARIAQVITLGTPHYGTALASRGPGRNSRQMEWNGESRYGESNAWLAQLAASESAQTRALITSIYSYQDNIVAPQLSSHLEGANNIALTGMGHVALALNPTVQQHVLEQIRRVS